MLQTGLGLCTYPLNRTLYIGSMKKRLTIYGLLFLLARCSPPGPPPRFSTSGNQVVQVLALHADSVQARMLLWERADSMTAWMCVDSFPVTLGRNGLAPGNDMPGRKIEGDGNSPAGVFRLSCVFSYHQLDDLRMPFERVDSNDLCVDDVQSVHYNQLVDKDTVAIQDYQSFERMQRPDAQYEYGVWVDYNSTPVVSGNGSCIFLHIWKEPGAATSGCTAMSKESMLRLIYWLDEKKKPVLVQYAGE